MLHQGKDELGSKQDESKDTAHTLQNMDPQIFHIQALLLIEAIAMFNAPTQTPIVVDLLGDGFG